METIKKGMTGISKEFLQFLAVVFAGASVAGWASLLWEQKPVTAWQKVGGVLLSGFAGLVVALLLYESLINKPSLLAGVSLLAGIGGASTLDWLIVKIAKRTGKLLDDDQT